VAAIFVIAVLGCGYFMAEAAFFPPGNIAAPRSIVVNELAAAKGIQFIPMEVVMSDPWYRAMMADPNPVVAPNESYFIGQLPAGAGSVYTYRQDHSTDGNSVVVNFWGINKNLTKPLKWEEAYRIPQNYEVKRIAENEIIFNYDIGWIVSISFLGAILCLMFALITWECSSYYARWRNDL